MVCKLCTKTHWTIYNTFHFHAIWPFSHLGILLCPNRHFQVLTCYFISFLVLTHLYVNINTYMSKHLIMVKITSKIHNLDNYVINEFLSLLQLFAQVVHDIQLFLYLLLIFSTRQHHNGHQNDHNTLVFSNYIQLLYNSFFIIFKTIEIGIVGIGQVIKEN